MITALQFASIGLSAIAFIVSIVLVVDNYRALRRYRR